MNVQKHVVPIHRQKLRSDVMEHFFIHTLLGSVILIILKTLALLVPMLVGVAYLTWLERKVLAAILLRKGP